MKIDETNEKYLEAIYFLTEQKEGVHAIDLCKSMGFSKPTVSVKLKQMVADGFLTIDENEHLVLTNTGWEIASKVAERHHLLTDIFVTLGVDAKVAEEDACKIEHDLSDETFACLKKHINKKK